jgi:hypothetical protein
LPESYRHTSCRSTAHRETIKYSTWQAAVSAIRYGAVMPVPKWNTTPLPAGILMTFVPPVPVRSSTKLVASRLTMQAPAEARHFAEVHGLLGDADVVLGAVVLLGRDVRERVALLQLGVGVLAVEQARLAEIVNSFATAGPSR